MKILVVSYYFPPYNTIGAIRVSKTAKYLKQCGHEVKILTAKNQTLPLNLSPDLSNNDVYATSWINVNKPIEILLGGSRKVAYEGYTSHKKFSLLKKPGYVYRELLNFPDGQIGWYPYALKEGKKLIDDWRPDIIFASAMPLTSLLIGSKLSKIYKIPWVGELRDLWIDHHAYQHSTIRTKLETKFEREILSTACGLVTVSEHLADQIKKKYNGPVKVILNGFDPTDYEGEMTSYKAPYHPKLNIVYTGKIYESNQDITPLLKALSILKGTRYENKITINLYGRDLNHVFNKVSSYGVNSFFKNNGFVNYKESIMKQKTADILLHLLWNDEKQKGIYTGKLFEYFGASRPILGIGTKNNLAAKLIISKKAGMVVDDPIIIAEQLKSLIKEKENKGFIEYHTSDDNIELTREFQTNKLITFINELLGRKGVESGDKVKHS
ncbi:glycosyltransferase [Alkalihalobacillus sp. R86527]|uniref:glycosyltransferase n=1 Tax=Alkalihalobacillus sp. R86527 TaxID=3093863 RepID=UPI00366C17A3